MFRALTFEDILQEERLREYNQCHIPPGGANGGQFCATPQGGSAADRLFGKGKAVSPKKDIARIDKLSGDLKRVGLGSQYSGDLAQARADAASKIGRKLKVRTSDPDNPYSAEYQAIGVPGFKPKATHQVQVGLAPKPALQPQVGAAPKPVKYKMTPPDASKGPYHVGDYRGIEVHTLPYTTPYYYANRPGFGSMHHTRSLPHLKRQIDTFHATGETAQGASRRKASERYQKRKARYGRG